MKRTLGFAVATALAGMLAFSGSALALRPGCDAPPCGGGGGNDPGGGGPPDGEAAQNLSVPTIMVGGTAGNLVCGEEAPSDLIAPTGEPLTGYEVPGDYWVQKVHTWQAQCFNSAATDEAPVSAFGNWGDNLEGDAKLKVGAPIRVEIVLTNMDEYPALTTLKGYMVTKLEPSLLDRLSAYGHAAVLEGDVYVDHPTDFGQALWLVHDDGITFSVQNLDTLEYAVQPGTNPTAEINATGKVVYGYNLRVNETGPYRILFTTAPEVEFTGVDGGDAAGLVDAHNAYIDINVVPGGGGGGKPR